MEEIVNRVASSALEVFDLEDYYPAGRRVLVDLSQWLDQGFILREKEFRSALQSHDWSQYAGCYVAIHCSTDAILPSWAPVLVATHLIPHAAKVVSGTLEDLERTLFIDALSKVDFSPYQNKPVILKGCSRKPVPDAAYIMAMEKLQPVAKSIMYGEACSSVPLYKKKNSSLNPEI